MFYADMMLFTVCVLHNTTLRKHQPEKQAEPHWAVFFTHRCVFFCVKQPVNSSFARYFIHGFQMSRRSQCTDVVFAGKWFVSTGKDNLLNAWRTPYGASIFQVCRSIILCLQPFQKYAHLFQRGRALRPLPDRTPLSVKTEPEILTWRRSLFEWHRASTWCHCNLIWRCSQLILST